MNQWIEIFRTGTHTSSNGVERAYTEADLHHMADSYDPAHHEAPVVIGHPKENGPAYGWVQGLRVAGGQLLARLHQVAPEFAEMVNAGRFKKRSIAIYPDGTLKHVGFLGAQPPAIKGLKDFAFSTDEAAEHFEFGEAEDVMPTLEELQAQLEHERKKRQQLEAENAQLKEQSQETEEHYAELQARTRAEKIDAFIEQGIREGRLLPAWKEAGLAQFMTALDEQEQVIEFSEAQQAPGQWFRDFLATFSEHPLFAEMAGPTKETAAEETQYSEDQQAGEAIAAHVNG